MWQTKLSFAVGCLLSAGSALAVADAQAQQGAERSVRSFSLVELVKKADEEGAAGQVPRISLVDLVGSTSAPEAEDVTDPPFVEGPPRGDAGREASQDQAASMESAGETLGALRTPSPRGAPPTGTEPPARTGASREAGTDFVGGPPRGDAGREASQDQAASPESAGETLGALRTPSPRGAPPTGTELPARTGALREAGIDFVGGPPRGDAGREASQDQAASMESAGETLGALRTPSRRGAPPTSSQLFDAEFDAESNKLQLFDAVRSALNEHPAIAESLSRLDGQQEQISVARAGYWPQLSSGINTGYRHTTGRSEEAFTVSASQMLYDFGKVSSAVEAAESGVDREEAGVLLAAEDLIRETALAFIEARRYEELVDLAAQQIEAIAELEALAAKRSALGASTVSDEMQAKSRREAARATQLQMQAQRDQWHRALENLIGSRQAVDLDDAYPEPLEGLCPRLPEHFDSAPRVVIAEAERAEAEAAIRQARAEQRPTLSLNADFEHYLNRDNRGAEQQLDDQEFVVSLNLSTNLFQGGALRARSRAAEHALYSANAARDRALLELSRLYRETRDRARSLTTSLALQDERYDSIVKTQELYRHQYLSLGTRTLLDILNTEQEIFQTQVDKQNTLFDLRSLQIDCLYSVGGLRDTFRAGEALDRRAWSHRAEVGL